MKITFSMEEAREIIRSFAIEKLGGTKTDDFPVLFVHRYADGSGECDIETLDVIQRVEVDLGD